MREQRARESEQVRERERNERKREQTVRDERQARARQTSTTYFYCTYRSHPTSRNFSLRHARPYTPFHSQVNFFSSCSLVFFLVLLFTLRRHFSFSPHFFLFSLSPLSTCNYSTSSRNTHTRYQLACVNRVSVFFDINFLSLYFSRVSSC